MELKEIYQGKKILLAEDDPFCQELIIDIFDPYECEIEIAETGTEVLAKYMSTDFDLILMDIHMPEKDGFEATEEIRRIETENHKRAIPIIALTADSLPETQKKCLEFGMNDYITKPIDLHDFRMMVAKYLMNRK